MLLNLDDITNIQDAKTSVISMPEWGGDIKVKAFDFAQQLEFEKQKNLLEDDSDLIMLMLRMSIVDEDNNYIFNQETIKLLGKRNSQALFKIFTACLEINALSEKGLENKAKN